MKIASQPSNNFTPGRLSQVKLGVVHTIGDDTEKELIRLKQPGESYHCVVDRSGTVYEMVSVKNSAWHCKEGLVGIPPIHNDIDKQSVGIALIGGEYTSKQYSSLAEIAADVETQVMTDGLGCIDHWVGHDWIAGEMAFLAGTVKEMVIDPGPKFSWEIFNRERYRCKLLHELTPEWRNKLRKEIEDGYSIGDLFKLIFKKCKP